MELRSKLLTELSSRYLCQNKFFSDFQSLSLMSFFCNFRKVWNRTISKISEHFPKFSKLFDPKTGFFDSKTGFFALDFKFYVYLFEIFVIDIKFWLISELFPNLNFWTFFWNFLQKFCEFENSGYFRTLKIELFWNSQKQKVGNFCLMHGLIFSQVFAHFLMPTLVFSTFDKIA